MPDKTALVTEQDRSLIQTFLTNHVWSEVSAEQQNKYRTLERNDLFFKGFHYAYKRTQQDGSVQWNSTVRQVAGEGLSTAYDYVLNYYRGDCKKLVGILGRTPNMLAMADDPTNEDQVERADTVNTLITELRWHWPLESFTAELVRMLWTDGLTFIYTPYYADGRKFGHTTLPHYAIKQVEIQPGGYLCPRCNAMNPLDNFLMICENCQDTLTPENEIQPQYEDLLVESGESKFANGSVGASLHNTCEVIISPKVKELEDTPFLVLENEHYKGAILEQYPEILQDRDLYKKIDGNGSGGNATRAREVRSKINSLYPYNAPRSKNNWTLQLIWLMPSMYQTLMASDDTASQAIGRMLNAEYPNGVKIPAVNGVPLKYEAECLLEVWHECKPEVGPTLDAQAIGSEYPSANRLIDDVANQMMEAAEKGLPFNFYDPQRIDPNVISQHGSHPVDFIPVMPGVGGDLRSIIHSTSGVEQSPVPMKMFEMFLSACRENAGVTPSLFGGETSAQTLGEATMKRNMALMPHNITWAFIRRMWEGAMTNACIQLAKYNIDTVFFGGDRNKPARSRKIDNLQKILLGGWHITADEQIPQTWGQEKAQVFQLLEMDPSISQGLLGMNNPNNVQTLLKALGNDDIQVPGVNEYKKVLSIIKELLQGAPVQSMGPMGAVMLPSIPADSFEVDSQFAVTVVKEWAAVPDNYDLKKTNEAGYANVIAWGKEHQSLIQPPQMDPSMGNGGNNNQPPPPSGVQSLLQPPPGGLSPESQPQLTPEQEPGALLA